MQRVTIKPPDPLEIEFRDGTIKRAIFNNETFIGFTEMYGPLTRAVLHQAKNEPYDLVSKLLHSGMVVLDHTATFEDAQLIVMSGGQELMSEIIRLMLDNFLTSSEESEIDSGSSSDLAGYEDESGINADFWESLYYSYCIKLMRPEEEFFKSTTAKIMRLLEINANGITSKEPVKRVTSMRDFLK